MTREMPRTLNALLKDAARALADRDTDRLEALMNHAHEWLQDTESREAQETLLDEMIDAAYELADYEEED